MSAPSRRCLSLWLRRLPTDRIERRLSARDDTPLVIVEPIKSALRVIARDDAAARLGVAEGAALADVRAMYPHIEARNADHAADHALLVAVADWCERYTPLVGLDPPHGIFLDIAGCAHLFGGERMLGRDLIARLARQGLQARIGIADTPGCAWAVARHGDVKLIARGEQREALLPLPLAALRLERDIISGLAQAGLKTIADIAARPRAPLAARFGNILLQRLDQALGDEDEPIRPRLPLPAYVAERRFPEPIGREEDVLGTLHQLAHELSSIMERRGEGARLLQVSLFRADGAVQRVEAAAGAPLRDPPRILRLFNERFTAIGDECDPGFGYDMVRLAALTAERLDPVQHGLAGENYEAELAHLLDRLGARLGAARVTRHIDADTHIPEYAAVAMPFSSSPPPKGEGEEEQDSLIPSRPLRLLARPEPVEALAQVPDGPPIRFRWRRVLHEVARAEGPERIAMEWWRDDPARSLTRDYFRVESKSGLRLWLYREGLYGRETGVPRWFLHGVFA